MKAMILAAGRGMRMQPLTCDYPKPLLTVAGKPLMVYHIEKLAQAGFSDIVINHSWQGQKIVAALGSGEKWGVRLHYSAEAEPLETAGGIIQALPKLGDAPFLVINGDIFCDYPLPPKTSLKDKLAHLVLVPNPEHHQQGDFYLDESHIVQKGAHCYTFSGISILSPALFAGIKKGCAKLAPFLHHALAQNKVSGELYQGLWRDVGTPQALADLEASLNHPLFIRSQ